MSKRILAFILSFLFCVTAVWADNFKDAQSLIENWFAAMKNKQYTEAENYLAPEFISLHTDGITRNKKQEMALIKKLDMTSYNLSNFKFSRSGDNIVVTYQDKGIEKIDNKEINAKKAGRLAVLQNQNGKWLILAYANLDVIG